MFAKSLLYSSLVALAIGKPIARRNSSPFNISPLVLHGGTFDINSPTISGFSSHHSFNNWGGLSSLNSFDNFYGSSDFCGISNSVVIQQETVVCQVTEVTVIQQQLAILAEYAKKVILTQSCETESQVLLFSQWMGNLVSFGQDLRRLHGHGPTFDSVIASEITHVTDISGNINVHDFGFSGSSIGSHSVSVFGGNWDNNFSPQYVGLTWSNVILAGGSEIFGSECSVCDVSSSVSSSVSVSSSESSVESVGESSFPDSGCTFDCAGPATVVSTDAA